MLLPSATASTLILLLSYQASAVPQPNGAAGLTMPLTRRSPTPLTDEEWGKWAQAHKQGSEAKYGKGKLETRGASMNLLTNQNKDVSYFGSLAIGTPPTSFNVILDTGSADLWVAGSSCQRGCGTTPTFDPSRSSSFKNESTKFSITYGSGRADGSIVSDTVQMGEFSVKKQIFAVCDRISLDLLQSPVSGLLGLAFQSIASSGAMPFWQALVSDRAWDLPLMSFFLTRYNNATSVKGEAPGGSFTMGYTNASLYTGDIEYISMPVKGSYWILPLVSMTVSGKSVTLPPGPPPHAAIDTGTTLIGGPPEDIRQIFAQINGSVAGMENWNGYYMYPCSPPVTVSLSFGGKDWVIDPIDFQLTRLSTGQCVGAFFALPTSDDLPSWIIGDTFLKNVYSVFRSDPLSIGFAQLSNIALAQNGARNSAPSPTIVPVSATVVAESSGANRRLGSFANFLSLARATVVAPVFVLSVLSLFSTFL